MRSVLVIEHSDGDGPGHFGEWLAARGRPMELLRVQAADRIPGDLNGLAGLCVLGGPMSANDTHLPHIAAEISLIRTALAGAVPVIGHCLGGQLLAKVLGASIGKSPQPEIGWHPITVADTAQAKHWFGDASSETVMQWHREAFGLPEGAIPLAGNPSCPQQAFACEGIHLAMQFHPEADRVKIDHWVEKRRARAWDPTTPATIQSDERIQAGTDAHLAAMRELAFRLYDRWAEGLKD